MRWCCAQCMCCKVLVLLLRFPLPPQVCCLLPVRWVMDGGCVFWLQRDVPLPKRDT